MLLIQSQETKDITVYTVWKKKQAQENPDGFKSIWVRLSYFKEFFLLMGKKRDS